MNVLDCLRARGLNPIQVSAAKGGEYASPCPGCGGKDRFHAFPEQEGGPVCQEAGVRGTYWCRKCGAGGDMLQYLLDFEGLDWASACAELGVQAPRRVAARGRLPQPPRKPEPKAFVPATLPLPPAIWRERAAHLVERAQAALLETPAALAWLAKRGFDLDAVRACRLGFLAAEPGKGGLPSTGIFRARSAWGLPPKVVVKADGAKVVRKSMWIPRGIVIPAYEPGAERDPDAQPIRLRIRRPNGDIKGTDQPKYFVIPGSGMAPMLLGADRRAFVVVEAELDALLLHYLAGDICGALAVLTNLGKPDATAHAALDHALTVLCALDYDPAGAKGWDWWRANCATARRWPVPAGKDPGDAYAQGADLRAWIYAGLPPYLRAAAEAAPAMSPAPQTQPVPNGQPAPNVQPEGASLSVAATTPEGEAACPPAPARPAPEPLPAWHAAILWADSKAARHSLAAWMSKHRVVYGPDSTGARAWRFPTGLTPAETNALCGELLDLVTPDLERLLLAHPARTVTARSLYETSCPRSAQ